MLESSWRDRAYGSKLPWYGATEDDNPLLWVDLEHLAPDADVVAAHIAGHFSKRVRPAGRCAGADGTATADAVAVARPSTGPKPRDDALKAPLSGDARHLDAVTFLVASPWLQLLAGFEALQVPILHHPKFSHPL